jgi:hypothetical protein
MNQMQSVKTNRLSILFLDSIYSLHILIIVICYFLDIFDHLLYSKYFYKNHILC